MDKKNRNTLIKSFGYAFQGILTGIRNERNMKIHCAAIILVTMAGTLFQITAVQWCICLLLFALVAALELVNTAVEAVVDLVTEEKKPLAKVAKDTAAGAVLIAAAASVIIGCIIFLPYVLELLGKI
ncbi:MAG TPA: diacylglycerol kinase family protein [Candidatus Mediterraneibacter pullistercoris]|nr:diacylglycerol kinase family protein [Candidatus Mediterraneibacter pullistercoris]